MLFVCLLVYCYCFTGRSNHLRKFQRNKSQKNAKLSFRHIHVISSFVNLLNHQSRREVKHTQGSDESALPGPRNLKYINIRGLSQMECPKSMANKCSPGDTGVKGDISQPDRGGQKWGAGRGFP